MKSTQGKPLKDEEKEYFKEINHWAVNPSALTGQRLALIFVFINGELARLKKELSGWFPARSVLSYTDC